MRCVILDRDDFRTEEDGHHLNAWSMILDAFELPRDTESIKVSYESHVSKASILTELKGGE